MIIILIFEALALLHLRCLCSSCVCGGQMRDCGCCFVACRMWHLDSVVLSFLSIKLGTDVVVTRYLTHRGNEYELRIFIHGERWSK